MSRIKTLCVFGTRPEAIKMAPLVKVFEELPEIFDSKVLVSAQHREMLDQVLEIFDIVPDHDLDIMAHGQTLEDITGKVVHGVGKILAEERPDLVLVHGDTTTTFAAALAAFYQQIPVGHVEAGLRSHNPYSPYPEEMNRQLTGRLSRWHFAPTQGNRDNLLREGVDADRIFVTGNTVIDALWRVVDPDYLNHHPIPGFNLNPERKLILLTAHRRENLGAPMRDIFSAIREIVETLEDVEVVYPMHLNPKVRVPAREILGGHPRIHLIEPLEYVPFANLMAVSDLVMTDSGGIQEEAPALGKPVLVLRQETERPEAVSAGTVKVVGVSRETIKSEAMRLLTDPASYRAMAEAVNPYGDGQAAQRIAALIRERIGSEPHAQLHT